MTARPSPIDTADLALIVEAAGAAGALAMRTFRLGERSTAPIRHKDGGSPVTEADLMADRLLHDRLTSQRPDYGWLSEESADDAARQQRRRVFIVDPIDGTRGYIAGDPAWTVCIAVIDDGHPVAGVVHAPAQGMIFAAVRGGGATLNGERRHVAPPRSRWRIAGPGGMIRTLEAEGVALDSVPRGPSLANRLMQVVGGHVDIALASGGAHEWDVAAAALILSEAGALLAPVDGVSLRFNRPLARLPVLIAAAPALHAQVAGLIR